MGSSLLSSGEPGDQLEQRRMVKAAVALRLERRDELRGDQNSTAENPAARAAPGRRSRGSSVNISEQLTR